MVVVVVVVVVVEAAAVIVVVVVVVVVVVTLTTTLRQSEDAGSKSGTVGWGWGGGVVGRGGGSPHLTPHCHHQNESAFRQRVPGCQSPEHSMQPVRTSQLLLRKENHYNGCHQFHRSDGAKGWSIPNKTFNKNKIMARLYR